MCIRRCPANNNVREQRIGSFVYIPQDVMVYAVGIADVCNSKAALSSRTA